MSKIAEEVAAKLLEVKAVKVQPSKPFTWASGWKSPIYCDNRLTLSYPAARTFIKDALATRVKEVFPDVEAIAGVARAGIPQAALVAEVLQLPMLYVGSKPKGHGMTNMIEGKLDAGTKVVLIEDLISTGGSSIAAGKAVQDAGGNVLGMLATVTYGFPQAEQNFEDAGFALFGVQVVSHQRSRLV